MAQPDKPIDPEVVLDSIPVRPGACPTASTMTRCISSQDLFSGAKMVLIEHAGEQYRLIETKNGKLILQK